jgi:hypothetical protein
LTQAYAVEHCPSALAPSVPIVASAPSFHPLPALPVPSFSARLPKIENYVKVTYNNGTHSAAGPAGLELAKTLFEHNRIALKKFTIADDMGSLATKGRLIKNSYV